MHGEKVVVRLLAAGDSVAPLAKVGLEPRQLDDLLAALLAPLSVGAIAAEPIPSPKPIFFATGSTSGTAGGRVMRGERNLYSVKATAGR